MDLGQNAVLAGHVVGLGSDRSQGWATQHVLAIGGPHQVGQVGMSAGELLYGQVAIAAGEVGDQVLGEARNV